MIIDSHQHFRDLILPFDYAWLQESLHPPICRSFLPPDLKEHLNSVNVRKSVFVQTQHSLDENRWALKLAEDNDFIAGIVGWALPELPWAVDHL